MDKTQERLERWCSAPGITFENSEAEEAFKNRTKRMANAVLLKTPDRVPITPTFGMFPALDNGFTCEEVFFDRHKAYTAWMKTLLDLKPDVYRLHIRPGSVWEIIGTLNLLAQHLLVCLARFIPVQRLSRPAM
jgi:hypothetical protein